MGGGVLIVNGNEEGKGVNLEKALSGWPRGGLLSPGGGKKRTPALRGNSGKGELPRGKRNVCEAGEKNGGVGGRGFAVLEAMRGGVEFRKGVLRPRGKKEKKESTKGGNINPGGRL